MNQIIIILLIAIIVMASVVAYLWARNRSLLLINEHNEESIKSLKFEHEAKLEKIKAEFLTTQNNAVAAERRRCEAEMDRIIENHKTENENNSALFDSKIKEIVAQMERRNQESLEKDKEELKKYNQEQIMSPVSDKLAELNKTVESVKESCIRDSAKNNEWREMLSKTVAESVEATNQLTGCIRSNGKVQGDWGETILVNTLESCGLRENVEFNIQHSSKNEQGRELRPDIIFNCPGNRKIVLDSKVSLTAFAKYTDAQNDEEKGRAAKEICTSVWNHVKELSDKNYYALDRDMLDMVLMFLPNEGALSVVLKEKPDLFNLAYNKGVVITTPSTIMIILHLIKDMWIREKQEENIEKIINIAGELYDKYATLSDFFAKASGSLSTAVSSFEDVRKCLSDGNGSFTKKLDNLLSLGAKRKKSKQINPVLVEQESYFVAGELTDAEIITVDSVKE